MPICPQALRQRLKYIVIDEFADKITKDGNAIHLSDANELNEKYNDDAFDPIDGSVINACDKISAYFEACISVKHGIKSEHLVGAITQAKNKNRSLNIQGIDYGLIYTTYMDKE